MVAARRSARAVLLDPRGQVLLLQGLLAEGSEQRAWYPPGGRLEEGESFAVALRRELREELGVLAAPVGPHVWTRRSTRRRGDVDVPAIAYFFLVRVAHFEPDLSNIGPSEADVIWRWWTLDDLRTTKDRVLPPRFVELLPPLIDGNLPAEPVDAG